MAEIFQSRPKPLEGEKQLFYALKLEIKTESMNISSGSELNLYVL